jgi:hypothetical protein
MWCSLLLVAGEAQHALHLADLGEDADCAPMLRHHLQLLRPGQEGAHRLDLQAQALGRCRCAGDSPRCPCA